MLGQEFRRVASGIDVLHTAPFWLFKAEDQAAEGLTTISCLISPNKREGNKAKAMNPSRTDGCAAARFPLPDKSHYESPSYCNATSEFRAVVGKY